MLNSDDDGDCLANIKAAKIDLQPLSIEALEQYIQELHMEIARVEAMIENKKQAANIAAMAFKN